MLRKVTKKILELVYKPLVVQYLKSDRPYNYKNLKLIVTKGVFHPAFFNSSLILAKFTDNLDLQNKKVLEIGSGSGLISLVAASKSAIVTAIDLNPDAVFCTQQNANRNNLSINCILSDLFQSLPQTKFNVILVNPPYFPQNPANNEQLAWYCGFNHEYFHRFFEQLPNYQNDTCEVFMILSEDVALREIEQIAIKFNFRFQLLTSNFKGLEWNYIYKIERHKNR
ncbi:MAG: methyltransferase [Bacteroidia bacterium]|nr:methyltransferase [Bacteroidota bacterium]MBP9081980.1 methyltransferase [Bacteroidia bacterium]MBK7970493.1 methyltransferase [Bacteroidota bacterium]MBK8876471.1 methyltransferase [Bacteroidota bacterium]MBK9046069.1 methyltransferase [Bacteroidota bacterium]